MDNLSEETMSAV